MNNNHYFIGKEKRIKKAKDWYNKMKNEYQKQTEESVKGTKHYTYSKQIYVINKRYESTNIIFLNMDTVSAIYHINDSDTGKLCALNFASYKNPGGMFLNGSSAQEESLCHESNLYNILENFKQDFYNPNKKKLNRGLYNDNMLYLPNVVFLRNDKEVYSDIITCAAPNKGTAQHYQAVSDDECISALESRINSILTTAYLENVDNFIIGAFGCGVFKNNPIDVASIFNSVLSNKYKNCFKNIIIAIPTMNERDNTMDIFKSAFNKRERK